MITIDQERLLKLVEEYKADFKENIPLELYKWEAVKHFQDNWDLDAEDFPAMLSRSLSKTENLLASMNNYPRRMIKQFAQRFPQDVKSLFVALYDETLNLKERIDTFIAGIEQIHKKWDGKEAKNHYHTFNVVSTYLWLRYPDKYYIYKPSVVKNLFDRLGIDIKLTPLKANAVIKTFEVYDSISDYLLKDLELKAMFEEVMTSNCYPDNLMKTATVDLGYYLKIKKKASTQVTKTTEKKYWMYAPGENASKWSRCQEQSHICIGWDGLGDLSEITSLEDCRDALKDLYNNPDSSFMNDGLAVWEFSHVMQPGDVVYAKHGQNNIIGRGIVKSDYIYDLSQEDFYHIRKIEWTHIGKWELGNIVQKTLTDITKYPDYVNKIEAMIVEGKNIAKNSRQYWWLVAAPDVWKFSDISAGEVIEYTLLNENGNKRRVYQNFLDAKAGDLVIGYASTPTLQVVALGEIAKDTDDKHLYFRKTEQLLNPIDYSIIKANEELQGMECMAGGGRGTLFKVKEEEYEILMEIIRKENPSSSTSTLEAYTDKEFLDEVFMSSSELKRLKALLKEKKNIILQGAPGVGKTFTAKRLAYTLMGVKDEQRVEMVQFHQNYSYEDFILGYKPNSEGGFELKHGVFYKFCKKALNSPDKDFFFIIDEINRGNLSKIFGELLMLIENGYRGQEIKLAYTDELFTVPKNLYIIGMMNTADRSLAMIDYALRRRFSFFEMKPGFATDGFKKYQALLAHEKLDNIIEGIQMLNETISKDDSLGNGFCIGHSYFCEQKTFSLEWLENVIEYDIEPMLKEYWFDDVQKYESHINKLRNLLK